MPVRFALGFLAIRSDRIIDLDSESDLDLDLDLNSDTGRETNCCSPIHDVYNERNEQPQSLFQRTGRPRKHALSQGSN